MTTEKMTVSVKIQTGKNKESKINGRVKKTNANETVELDIKVHKAKKIKKGTLKVRSDQKKTKTIK